MNALSNFETLDLQTFLKRNRISQEDFEKATIDWELLRYIGHDHLSFFDARKESAEFFAKVIQGCNKVHSVRWRVKDPEHLMEKIVRKRIPNSDTFNEKYLGISVDNYHEIVTDLVGIRALHLFKDDYVDIDIYLRERWNHSSSESPTYYYRAGDVQESVPSIFNKKQHPAGYRSIHYIFESQPLNKRLFTEVQVRTIFEEGWSEIDHKVRYPNFSEEKTTKYFLDIFNRLAGSADEMGSFVKALDVELKNRAELLVISTNESQKLRVENEESMASIERLINELEASKGKISESSNTISNLKRQVEKLKATSDIKSSLDLTRVGYLTGKSIYGIASDIELVDKPLTYLSTNNMNGINSLLEAAGSVSLGNKYRQGLFPEIAKAGDTSNKLRSTMLNTTTPDLASIKKPKEKK